MRRATYDWTPEEDQFLLKSRAAGVTQIALAVHFQCARSTIRGRLKALATPAAPPTPKPKPVPRAPADGAPTRTLTQLEALRQKHGLDDPDRAARIAARRAANDARIAAAHALRMQQQTTPMTWERVVARQQTRRRHAD